MTWALSWSLAQRVQCGDRSRAGPSLQCLRQGLDLFYGSCFHVPSLLCVPYRAGEAATALLQCVNAKSWTRKENAVDKGRCHSASK